jgi:hypothetical protein
MATSRPTGIIVLAVGAVAVFGFAFAGPLLFAGTDPAPPPAPVSYCPEQPQRDAGHRFTTEDDLIQADLRCADLRDAVFDGLDLTQADLRGADLRGASLRHTDLTQADLTEARLSGADLSFADLTQATLTGADVRGAQMWLASSIQTGTGGLRIGAGERGVIQLGYLTVVIALAVLVRSLARLARGIRPQRGIGRVRPAAARVGGLLLVVPAVAVFAYLTLGQLFELWLVDLVRPLAVGEAVLLVAFAVEQFRPVPADETGPVMPG